MSKYTQISTNRILIQETVGSTTTTKFDTNFLFLKTDASGNFKAGGYEPCPTFYGREQSEGGISDKDNGWYPAYFPHGVDFTTNDHTTGSTIYLAVPKATQRKLIIPQPIIYPTQPDFVYLNQYYSTGSQLYNPNTGTGISGSWFVWTARAWRYSETVGDSENAVITNYYGYVIYPHSVTLPNSFSGTIGLPYSPGDIKNFNTTGVLGNTNTFQSNEWKYYSATYVDYTYYPAYYAYRYGGIAKMLGFSIHSREDPQTLSITVTQ